MGAVVDNQNVPLHRVGNRAARIVDYSARDGRAGAQTAPNDRSTTVRDNGRSEKKYRGSGGAGCERGGLTLVRQRCAQTVVRGKILRVVFSFFFLNKDCCVWLVPCLRLRHGRRASSVGSEGWRPGRARGRDALDGRPPGSWVPPGAERAGKPERKVRRERLCCIGGGLVWCVTKGPRGNPGVCRARRGRWPPYRARRPPRCPGSA